jgi:hypothetical protein
MPRFTHLNLNLTTQADSAMRSSPMDTQEKEIHDIARSITPENCSQAAQLTHAPPTRHYDTSSAAMSSSTISRIKYVFRSGSHSKGRGQHPPTISISPGLRISRVRIGEITQGRYRSQRWISEVTDETRERYSTTAVSVWYLFQPNSLYQARSAIVEILSGCNCSLT